MSDDYSWLNLSIIDAANNCIRHNAIGIVTLRSGVIIEGEIEKPVVPNQTVHVKTSDGGWQTFLVEELAGVGVKPKVRR